MRSEIQAIRVDGICKSGASYHMLEYPGTPSILLYVNNRNVGLAQRSLSNRDEVTWKGYATYPSFHAFKRAFIAAN